MTDGDALLKAILDQPEEDTPRLLFADFLDEQGDHDRAEFIRVQVELARLAPDEDGHRLEVRATELLARHEDEWAGPLMKRFLWHQFRRGFVEAVGVEAQAFLGHAADLFGLTPVRRAAIRASPGELPAVLRSPYLARLRSLGLGGLLDAGAELLAGSPRLAGVEELDLSRGFLGPEGAGALARSPHLSGLGSLLLGSNRLGDDGLEALARAEFLPRLSRLDVAQNRIGPRGVEALAAGPLVSRLGALRLDHNPVGPDGARALAASAPLTERCRLGTLDLYGCELGDAGVVSLAAARWAASLRRLNLSLNGIGEEGVEALVESPYLTGLTHLDLAGNHLSDEDRFALRGRFGMAVRL